MTTSLLTCKCSAKNRLTLGGPPKRHRCGKCKHEFTPAELCKAVVEKPVAPPAGGEFDLEPTDDIEYECDDPSCGWYGEARDANQDANNRLTCPSCGTKLTKVEEDDEDA